MKYKLLVDHELKTYAVVLDDGDEVTTQLLAFAKKNHIHAASFTAIGAFNKLTIGYFDFAIKDYKKIPIEEQVEVIALTGNIALYENEPKLHAHVVVGKSDGTAHGGHLLKAFVHPTLEVMLTETPAHLVREINTATGLPLLDVG